MNSRNINPNIKNSPKDLKEKNAENNTYYKAPIDGDVLKESQALIDKLEHKVGAKGKKQKKSKNKSFVGGNVNLKKLFMVSGIVAACLIIFALIFVLVFGHKNLQVTKILESNASVFVWDNLSSDESQGRPAVAIPLSDYTKGSVSDSDLRKQSVIEFTVAENVDMARVYKIAFKIKVKGTGVLSLRLTMDNYDPANSDCVQSYSKLFKTSGENQTAEVVFNYKFEKVSGTSEFEKNKIRFEVATQSSPNTNGSSTEDTIESFAIYNLKLVK